MAPFCTYYQASDFSGTALRFIEQQLPELGLSHIVLQQGLADDFSKVEPGSFDLIILNSIVQYFPDVNYLLQVLEGALKVLKPGGAIFIGDVRNFTALEAYHTSIEFYQAPGELTKEQLFQQIQKRMKEQEELLIAPAFFKEFARILTIPVDLQLQYKRGHAHNELTRFRYDALLRTYTIGAELSWQTVDWQTADMSYEHLRTLLSEVRSAIRFINVPDARLIDEVKAIAWLRSYAQPETVGEMRRMLAQTRKNGVEAEVLLSLGKQLGYITSVTFTQDDKVGHFEVRFTPGTSVWLPGTQVEQSYSNLNRWQEGKTPTWHRYINTPLQNRLSRQIIPHLKSYLQAQLPTYMQPSTFVVIDALPLTANGKVDRRALPDPDQEQSRTTSMFIAPGTPIEKSLSAIWCYLLNLEIVSINDNFFDLGGHSLLATQLVSMIRTRLQVELPLRILWEASTIKELAEHVESLQKVTSALHLLPIVSVPRTEELPLSYAQQRLWFLSELEPGNPAYNMPAALYMRGALNRMALEQSLQSIVQRHEALRTTLHLGQDHPVQRIAPTLTVLLPIIDLTGLPIAQTETVAHELALQSARIAFDLSTLPLIYTGLMQLNTDTHILLNILHHSIADGWSVGILIKEMIACYSALNRDVQPDLTPILFHYIDFALWQREWLQGQIREQELAYWRQQLAGLPMLELLTDYPRPFEQSYHGSVQRFTLSQELSKAVRDFCQRENVTNFMLLLAAFQILLARYSGQEDIAVGTDIANRDFSEFENIIGFFVNTLVLRSNLAGNSIIQEFLGRVRETCLEAYTHQHLPFEELVDVLQPERDLSRNPLFQVHFALQNSSLGKITMQDITLHPFDIHNATSKFDLSLNMVEHGEYLDGAIEYNTDLFRTETIARMIQHFQVVLEYILGNPLQPLSKLSLLTSDEHLLQVYQWNQTQCALPEPLCFHQLFARQVKCYATSTAATCQGLSLSYTELDQRSNQLAHLLQQAGVKAETLVGVYMHRSLEMLVSIVAIFKAGGTYMPLDPAYPADRLNLMLEDAAVKFLLSQPDLALPVLRLPIKQIYLDPTWQLLNSYNIHAPTIASDPEQLAYVIYTSGSTGRPKGVMINQRGMLNHLYAKIMSLKICADDRLAQTASHCFDISVWQFLSALLVGGEVCILPDDITHNPETLRHAIFSEGITILELVPTLLRVWLDLPDQRGDQTPGTLRWMMVTGEACPVELARHWLQSYPHVPLVNAYGPTECSDDVTHAYIYQANDLSMTGTLQLGKPINNTQIYILDRYTSPVPVGVAGEVYVGGSGVGRGYLGQPANTAQAFLPDPLGTQSGGRLYRTGDLARYLPDGQLEFLGRVDEQVKIRGYRIELGEIETRLEQYPTVKVAAVLVKEQISGHKTLIAYIVPENWAGEDQDAILSQELQVFLQGQLPEYMVPAIFVLLEALPLTPNGKLNRQALPMPNQQDAIHPQGLQEPRTEVEARLAEIWAEVFGVSKVSISDNFFALGGDSILSIQIIARANQQGLNFTPKQVFRHQTIEELSQVVEHRPIILAEQDLVTGSLPLTPIQCWFFEQQFSYPDHWNQSLLLEVQQSVDEQFLKEAFQAIIGHHDALRLRFVINDGTWEQFVSGLTDDLPLIIFDFSTVDEAEQALRAKEAELQASLNLKEGPLMQAAFFKRGRHKKSLLLIIIHHLVIDGISWRILLEDLQKAYQQLQAGVEVQLPAKTTSYKHWAEALTAYTQSQSLQVEQAFWLASERVEPRSLPIDYLQMLRENREETVYILSNSLTAQETRVLLEEVPAIYQTRINDILLTALTQTLVAWTDQQYVLIDLEGHGREELFAEIDVTRTIGWFTAQYPVLLKLEKHLTEGDALKAIKEQLRCIPNQGLGYGLLLYLNNDAELNAQLRAFPQAEILFNYLGQFDQTLSNSSLFSLKGQSTGPLHHPQDHRSHLLEINCIIQEGALQIDWLYSQQFHHRETIEGLLTMYVTHLRALIKHCQSSGAGGYTPSDFPDVKLSQDELDQLIAEIETD